MKTLLSFHSIVHAIFWIGTLLIFFAMNKETTASLLMNGYLMYLVFYVVFLIYVGISKTRKLKWAQLKERIVRFIGWFLSLSAVHYLMNWEIDIWGLAVPLGLSLGLVFSEFMTN
ncbi:hypothetical protein SAMN04490247_0958 [Salimicrobium halophilum]|uniref:Uncharacterized protein n=1 Tax=Salimicrobium halophilum TaxID=86666 RepID=A0A1G8RD67_9BACI|nr:hypothetical protein SAMN04490247_0958 [Salimicrobium halophilum]